MMNLNIISSEGIQVNNEMERNMQLKFEALGNIYDRITGFEVSMKRLDSSAENNCIMEGRVLLSKSSFFCKEKASSFEIALDQVIENLKGQLKRHKDQRTEIW